VRCRRIHRPSAAVVERLTQQAQGPRPRQLPRSPHAASGAPRQQRSPEGSPWRRRGRRGCSSASS
jgi:hypothetical protein